MNRTWPEVRQVQYRGAHVVAPRKKAHMVIVRLTKAVLVGGSAAALAGVASGVVTRALMSAVARLVHEPTHFSLGGSAGIALIYTVALLPGCVALACTHRRWPWVVLGAGAALLIFEAVAIGVQETAAARDLTPMRLTALLIVLLAMAGAYGLQFRVAAQLARRTR